MRPRNDEVGKCDPNLGNSNSQLRQPKAKSQRERSLGLSSVIEVKARGEITQGK